MMLLTSILFEFELIPDLTKAQIFFIQVQQQISSLDYRLFWVQLLPMRQVVIQILILVYILVPTLVVLPALFYIPRWFLLPVLYPFLSQVLKWLQLLFNSMILISMLIIKGKNINNSLSSSIWNANKQFYP